MLIAIEIVLVDWTPIYRLVEVDAGARPTRDAIDRVVYQIAVDEHLKIREWHLCAERGAREETPCR